MIQKCLNQSVHYKSKCYLCTPLRIHILFWLNKEQNGSTRCTQGFKDSLYFLEAPRLSTAPKLGE